MSSGAGWVAQGGFVPSCGEGMTVGAFDAVDLLIGWFAV
jgi:hypothetical protein